MLNKKAILLVTVLIAALLMVACVAQPPAAPPAEQEAPAAEEAAEEAPAAEEAAEEEAPAAEEEVVPTSTPVAGAEGEAAQSVVAGELAPPVVATPCGDDCPFEGQTVMQGAGRILRFNRLRCGE